jgi:hypothetical protein
LAHSLHYSELAMNFDRISPAEHEELMRHVPKNSEEFRDILNGLRHLGPQNEEPYATGLRKPGEPLKVVVNRNFLNQVALTMFVRNSRSHDALSVRSALYHDAKFGRYWLK